MARTELETTLAEAARVRAEAAAMLAKAEQFQANALRQRRDAKVRLRATAVVMMAAALVKLGWEAAHTPAPASKVSAIHPLMSSEVTVRLAPVRGGEGKKALERLRNAFHAFPDEDQVSVVRQANAKYSSNGNAACPLVWKEGVPALYVGYRTGDLSYPLIAKALDQCTVAVERLRAERDAVIEARYPTK